MLTLALRHLSAATLAALFLFFTPAHAQDAKPLVITGELTKKDPFDKVRKASHHKVHELELKAGEIYMIDLQSADFDTFLRLEDGAGQKISENDDVSENDRNSRLGLVPKKSGKYRAVVTTFDGGLTGRYTLQVATLKKVGKPKVLAGKITEKSPKSKSGYSSELHKVEFKAGEFWLIDLMSTDFDPVLYVYTPKGALMAFDDDGGEGLNSRLVVGFADTGEHQLRALALGVATKGDYTLRMQRLERKTPLEVTQAEGWRRETVKLNRRGLELFNSGRYREAQDPWGQALELFQKLYPKATHPNGHRDLATSLNDLGIVQYSLGDYAAAQKSHEEALAIRRKVLFKDHPDIAVSLNNLGNVQADLRDYEGARKSYEEALAITRKALPKDHPDIARSLINLGSMLVDLRDYAAARQSFEEALAIYRKALPKDHPDIASSLNNLGIVQQNLRDYAAARQSHEEALAIRRKALTKDHRDIAMSLGNLGIVQSGLLNYAAARKSQDEALAIYRKALPKDHPAIVRSLNNLGNVQANLRDYAAARKSHEEALAIRRKALPKDHPDIAISLVNLGHLDCISENINRETVARLTEATDLFQANQLRLAFAQAEQEQLATAAHSHFSVNLLLTATLTTQADLDSAYDWVVRVKGSVTAQQLWTRQARDEADPDTTRLLTRLRQVTGQLVGLSVTGSQDVVALMRSLSDERAALERQLSERSQVFRAFQARARIGSSEVRAALPEDVALVDLVEYTYVSPPIKGQNGVTNEDRVLAFVVRRGQKTVDAVPLGSSKVLAELIDRWRSSHGAGKAPLGGTPDPGAELRKRLWEPLEKHLVGIKVVLVSPDGPLHGLPWAALPGAAKGTFLIHDHAFAVVPVPQLLPDLLRGGTHRPADAASLVIGNIDFDALTDSPAELKPVNRFQPLPGTKAEAAAVHDLFRKAFADRPAELLTGKGATKEAFISRATKCSHLLVATHGFFLPDPERKESSGQRSPLEALLFRRDLAMTNPALRSGLAFAGANRTALGRGDAFLTAFEVSVLDLNRVDLAVLSACETGLGKVEDGEGVLGLQRAFQVAGARTTVTSLWNVPDAATQALMTRFHRNLWEKKDATPLGKLAALREAQLWLIKDGPKNPELLRGGLVRPDLKSKEGDSVSPFYWAAFVLSGDWR
jgi:CHAT domain-containing protein